MPETIGWPLTTWTDAGRLVAAIDPEGDVAEASGVPPAEWFARLRAAGRTFEAVAFIAHALPRYECVAWAARALVEGGVLDRADPFVTATLRWIDAPEDALRRAAGQLADESGRSNAGEMLCRAVFYSGGSIAPDDLPPVQPPPHVCARMAAGAVLTGAYTLPDARAALDAAFVIGDAMAALR